MYNLSMESVILIGIILLCTTIAGVSIYAIHCYNRHNKAVEREVQRQGNISANISQDLPDILDSAITQIFVDYQMINLLPAYTDYINSEKEKEILKGLTEAVNVKLSRSLLEHVSVFYNIDNIDIVLSDKIYLLVTEYVVNHNAKFVGEE